MFNEIVETAASLGTRISHCHELFQDAAKRFLGPQYVPGISCNFLSIFRTPAPPEGVERPRPKPYGLTKKPSESSLVARVSTKNYKKSPKTRYQTPKSSVPHSFVWVKRVLKSLENLIYTQQCSYQQ